MSGSLLNDSIQTMRRQIFAAQNSHSSIDLTTSYGSHDVGGKVSVGGFRTLIGRRSPFLCYSLRGKGAEKSAVQSLPCTANWRDTTG